MFSKLDTIHKKPNNEIIKKLKPEFEFNQKFKDGGLTKEQKAEIKTMNNFYYKKLKKQSSCYNLDKLNKEYEQNQYYKKNICEFPCIDFHKRKQILLDRKSTKYENSIIKISNNIFNKTKFKQSDLFSEKMNTADKIE